MAKNINYDLARQIMKENLIEIDELASMPEMLLELPKYLPIIPFSEEELKSKKDNYYLIYGCSKFSNGDPITIRSLKDIFGDNPNVKEPCFYNQDWYDKESFIDKPMTEGWFLIRKNVFEESRAVRPEILVENYSFPSAIRCTYAFFIAWITRSVKLWYHDFVWCDDTDHNGDRVYVGKYHDIDGVNKNGFSIHRHLNLRSCYGCIDEIK